VSEGRSLRGRGFSGRLGRGSRGVRGRQKHLDKKVPAANDEEQEEGHHQDQCRRAELFVGPPAGASAVLGSSAAKPGRLAIKLLKLLAVSEL
jgi:hypothetical protein